MQCSAVQCSAVQCSAVQCSAVQCSAVQYSTVQYSTTEHSTILYLTWIVQFFLLPFHPPDQILVDNPVFHRTRRHSLPSSQLRGTIPHTGQVGNTVQAGRGFSAALFSLFQVVIPGYCVAGTVGHKVLAGQKKIELDKKTVVRAETYIPHKAGRHCMCDLCYDSACLSSVRWFLLLLCVCFVGCRWFGFALVHLFICWFVCFRVCFLFLVVHPFVCM